MKALEKEFGSKDPEAWKIDRPTYPVGSEGGGVVPRAVPVLRPRHLDRAHRARSLAGLLSQGGNRLFALDDAR